MSNLLLSKIGHVISEFPLAFKQTKEVKLFMTLLVKNEEGMLEENLQFHKAMGVDGFIITDNNSTDSTPDIIRKYKQKGWIKEVIEEKATNYEQKDWVDRFGKPKPFIRPTGLSMPMPTNYGMPLPAI